MRIHCFALLAGLLLLPHFASGLKADQSSHRVLVGGCGYGEVAVYAADGSKEWSYPEKREVSDAWLLPNGDIAMAYKYGARIIRPNWKNQSGFEVVLDYPTPRNGETHTCTPLPDGGYLIGESFDGTSFIVELDSEFNETKRIELKGLGGRHTTFRQISKTPQNSYLITQQRKDGVALEIDARGAIIRRFSEGRFAAKRLANGNTLLTGGDRGCILEVDTKDKVVWSLEKNDLQDITLGFTASVERLPNGNTLFANWGGHGGATGPSLIEVTPDKNVVWSASYGKANRISTVKVIK